MSWSNMLRCVALLLLGAIITHSAENEVTVCDKRPSGTETPQTRADGRFVMDVVGIVKNQFLPGGNYTVVLKADENSSFIAFLIMADGEEKGDARNRYYLESGTLRPKPNGDVPTQMHSGCKNVVQQSNNSPKNVVEVEWIAPRKDQGCVTIHAMVAESQDVWYMDDGPLSMRVCEDTRKSEDIPPQPIDQCDACEEVKYELTFEGQWSRNTHPRLFPDVLTRRFSDLVGASHSSNYHLWDFNKRASAGLKLLAEAANTTILEQEIQNHFDSGVRTLIKASGHGVNNLLEPTSAIFRADRTHHLISIATSIFPSPDWFLGVTHFELCFKNNTWVTEREYYLHLIDAGTDNGVSYESSNEETLPPGLITPIMESLDNMKSPFYNPDPGSLRHFAKMRVKMLRLYRETCNEDQDSNRYEQPTKIHGSVEETTFYPKIETDINDPCPVSKWYDWSECDGECGKEGYRYRERYNIVNGVEYRYYAGTAPSNVQQPPEECRNTNLFDLAPCTSDPC